MSVAVRESGHSLMYKYRQQIFDYSAQFLGSYNSDLGIIRMSYCARQVMVYVVKVIKTVSSASICCCQFYHECRFAYTQFKCRFCRRCQIRNDNGATMVRRKQVCKNYIIWRISPNLISSSLSKSEATTNACREYSFTEYVLKKCGDMCNNKSMGEFTPRPPATTHIQRLILCLGHGCRKYQSVTFVKVAIVRIREFLHYFNNSTCIIIIQYIHGFTYIQFYTFIFFARVLIALC